MCFYFFCLCINCRILSNGIIKLHTSREKKNKKREILLGKGREYIYSIKIFIERLILSMNCAVC